MMAVASSQFGQRFILSVLVVSGLYSKLLHIYQHRSLPLYAIVLYFPTFFVEEVLLFVAVWLALYKSSGWAKSAAFLACGFLAFLDLLATSSQFSFFTTTGGEIRWSTARSLGSSKHGIGLILSGLAPTLAAMAVMLIIAWFAAVPLSRLMHRWLSPLFDSSWTNSMKGDSLPGAATVILSSNRSRFWTVYCTVFTLALLIIRPATPYNHMTGALPFIMFGGQSITSLGADQFPLPSLLDKEFWEPANGHYKGWEPDERLSASAKQVGPLPSWARESLPAGFDRWAIAREDYAKTSAETNANTANDNTTRHERFRYDPKRDPMRLTNMDQELLGSLQTALDERDIPIQHVVFVFLESGRKDLFPFKKGSNLYDKILETNGVKGNEGQDQLASLFGKFSRLTPIAELLTGESSGFNETTEEWATTSEFGGINVDGAVTGSTLSSKARLVDYCGVNPLPVDFMHENNVMPYQPCLMQILELFNRRKAPTGNPNEPDFTEKQWKTIYAQSITGGFQDQFKLMELMGFSESLYYENIKEESAKYWHPKTEKVNYFGYAETELIPYVRDMINQTLRENKRLFFSHFTSSTHHPWATPEGFPKEEYFGNHGPLSGNRDMDHYLNTCRFVDSWLGDIMGLLHEAGIANQTLTVFVGDHGQAFKQDSDMSGTYQNPHITNFQIPLLFHHPLLPRIKLNANASTISILPTILDLLVNTGSLNDKDTDIALDLMNEYEGQSLIRPYQLSRNGREAWNVGVINKGGTRLSISSAAVPYRLVLPIAPDFEYYFSNLDADPHETAAITGWTMSALGASIRSRYGYEAYEWAVKAEKVAHWWVRRQKLLWDYGDPKK